MPTIHENQQVTRVDQQMKKIVASTSDASTRLVTRLLPKSSPQTTAVSHRCKRKYVDRIINVNVHVITFVRPGLPPGWTWWVSSRTLSRGFSQEGS